MFQGETSNFPYVLSMKEPANKKFIGRINKNLKSASRVEWLVSPVTHMPAVLYSDCGSHLQGDATDSNIILLTFTQPRLSKFTSNTQQI